MRTVSIAGFKLRLELEWTPDAPAAAAAGAEAPVADLGVGEEEEETGLLPGGGGGGTVAHPLDSLLGAGALEAEHDRDSAGEESGADDSDDELVQHQRYRLIISGLEVAGLRAADENGR